MSAARADLRGQPMMMDAEIAMSGIMRGPINIAPTTTAVVSAKTPNVGIAVAEPIKSKNRDNRRPAGPSKKSFS